MKKGTNNDNELEGTNGEEIEIEALELDMRVSTKMLLPYSKNRFIYHARSSYAVCWEDMTACRHNLRPTPTFAHGKLCTTKYHQCGLYSAS